MHPGMLGGWAAQDMPTTCSLISGDAHLPLLSSGCSPSGPGSRAVLSPPAQLRARGGFHVFTRLSPLIVS